MGFFNNFPYTNFHDLNLDWVLREIKNIKEYVENYTAINNVSYAGIWDITKQYPQWSVVSSGDCVYMSKKPVPLGIDISNEEYWIKLADLDPRIGGLISRIEDLNLTIENLGLASVKNYGAVGDGITDDSDAFVKALEENDSVYIPEGVYYLDKTVTLPPNKTLYSMIKGQSRIIYNKNNNCFNLTHDNRLENIIIETNGGNNFALFCDNGYNINIFRVDNLGGSFYNTKSKYFKISGSDWHTVLIYNSIVDCGTENGNALEFIGTPNSMSVNRDVHIAYCFIDALMLDGDVGSTILFKDVYAPSCEYCLIRAKVGEAAIRIVTSDLSGKGSDLWLGFCEIRIGRVVVGNNCTLFTDGYNSVIENNGLVNKMVDGRVKSIRNFKYNLVGECIVSKELDGTLQLFKGSESRGLVGVETVATTPGMVIHCKYSGITRPVGGFYVGVKNGNNSDVVCVNISQKTVQDSSVKYNAISSMSFKNLSEIYGRFDISDCVFYDDMWFNIVKNGNTVIWYYSTDGRAWCECFRINTEYDPVNFTFGMLDTSEAGIGYQTSIIVDSISFG